MVAVTISTILSMGTGGCGRNKDVSSLEIFEDPDITTVQQPISQNNHPTKLLLQFLQETGKDFDTMQKVSFNREKLEKLYELYTNTDMSPNVKAYIQSILLRAYIEILETGYTLNGYQDLDTLRDIISNLSNGRITLRSTRSMPENTEFNQVINIKAELKDQVLFLEQLGGILRRGSSVGNAYIGIYLDQLLESHMRDTPESLQNAKHVIAELNTLYTNAFRELREAKIQVGILDFKIDELREQMQDLEISYNNSINTIQSQKDADIAKNQQEKQQEIKRLISDYEKQIRALRSDINQKEITIQEKQQDHQRHISQIQSRHAVQIQTIQDNANARIIEIDNNFLERREELEQKIDASEQEVQRLREIHNIQINTLNEQNKQLQDDLKNISEENIQLTNTIVILENRIERLEREKTSLLAVRRDIEQQLELISQDKTVLTEQIDAVGSARDTLLYRTQQNLRESEGLNRRLQNRISELDTRVSDLLQITEDLKRKKGELLDNIRTHTNYITTLEAQQQNLEHEIDLLQKQNNQLTTKNKSLQTERDNALTQSHNHVSSIEGELNTTIQQRDNFSYQLENAHTDIQILQGEKGVLQDIVATQEQRNQALLRQLKELQNAFETIQTGEMEISQGAMSEAFRSAMEENQRLQQENQRLENQRLEAREEVISLERELNQVRAESAERLQQQQEEFQQKLTDYILGR